MTAGGKQWKMPFKTTEEDEEEIQETVAVAKEIAVDAAILPKSRGSPVGSNARLKNTNMNLSDVADWLKWQK